MPRECDAVEVLERQGGAARMRPARPARRAPPPAAEPTGRRLPSRRRRTLAATLRSSASASRWS